MDSDSTEPFPKRMLQQANTDEWFTPETAITPLLPYISQFKRIWCPFDHNDSVIQSNFVKVLTDAGHAVINSHIDYGQDFFTYSPSQPYDAIISNPPYSLRNEVLERLYALGKPFAMLVNYSGLFDNRIRFKLFQENGVQLFVLYGRTKFYKRGTLPDSGLSPLFQSIYVCNKILPQDILFQSTDCVQH